MPEGWGLKADGEIIRVIRWGQQYRPSLFDFNWPSLGEIEYEIVPVHVTEPTW